MHLIVVKAALLLSSSFLLKTREILIEFSGKILVQLTIYLRRRNSVQFFYSKYNYCKQKGIKIFT